MLSLDLCSSEMSISSSHASDGMIETLHMLTPHMSFATFPPDTNSMTSSTSLSDLSPPSSSLPSMAVIFFSSLSTVSLLQFTSNHLFLETSLSPTPVSTTVFSSTNTFFTTSLSTYTHLSLSTKAPQVTHAALPLISPTTYTQLFSTPSSVSSPPMNTLQNTIFFSASPASPVSTKTAQRSSFFLVTSLFSTFAVAFDVTTKPKISTTSTGVSATSLG